MEIILVRHTSVAVPKGTCYGWTDVELSNTFEQEATATHKALLDYAPFDAAYTSPLSRATRLATFCGYKDATTDLRLREMNMGDWEMRLYDDIAKERANNQRRRLPRPLCSCFKLSQPAQNATPSTGCGVRTWRRFGVRRHLRRIV